MQRTNYLSLIFARGTDIARQLRSQSPPFNGLEVLHIEFLCDYHLVHVLATIRRHYARFGTVTVHLNIHVISFRT